MKKNKILRIEGIDGKSYWAIKKKAGKEEWYEYFEDYKEAYLEKLGENRKEKIE